MNDIACEIFRKNKYTGIENKTFASSQKRMKRYMWLVGMQNGKILVRGCTLADMWDGKVWNVMYNMRTIGNKILLYMEFMQNV
jgi:hypothetical protein